MDTLNLTHTLMYIYNISKYWHWRRFIRISIAHSTLLRNCQVCIEMDEMSWLCITHMNTGISSTMQYDISANVSCQLALWQGHTVARHPINQVLNSALDKAAAELLKKKVLTLLACTRPECWDITLTSQRNERGHERSQDSSGLFPDGVLAQKNMFNIHNKHLRWPKRLIFEHFHLHASLWLQ